jgi:hypothetical protein
MPTNYNQIIEPLIVDLDKIEQQLIARIETALRG